MHYETLAYSLRSRPHGLRIHVSTVGAFWAPGGLTTGGEGWGGRAVGGFVDSLEFHQVGEGQVLVAVFGGWHFGAVVMGKLWRKVVGAGVVVAVVVEVMIARLHCRAIGDV